MQLPLQITFRGMDPSEAVEARVREKSNKLERYHDKITRCHVTISAPHQHQHKGAVFDVRIDITVPGREIVVTREPAKNGAHTDVYVALRDAFSAAARQLEDHQRRRRGKVKVHDAPPHGRVVVLVPDEDYGLLETPDGLQVYFHRNAVVNEAYDELSQGSEVRYVLADGEGEKGPQASTVHVVGKHHVI